MVNRRRERSGRLDQGKALTREVSCIHGGSNAQRPLSKRVAAQTQVSEAK